MLHPEPQWGLPQEAIEVISSLQYTGPTPFYLTGILIRLLQYHFCDPNNIETTVLKGYLWTPDETEGISNADGSVSNSRLLIRASYQREGVAIQQRPALFVQREQVKLSRLGFESKSLPTVNRTTGIHQGAKYQVMIDGAHSIICVGVTGVEAENIGQEVMMRMLHYMPLIKSDFRLAAFFIPELTEVKELAEDIKKVFWVAVRLTWAYVHEWKVVPETPVVKRLSLNFE